MKSKGWISGLVGASVSAGFQMFFDASAAHATTRNLGAEWEASKAMRDLISEVASNLLGGPRTAESLSEQQRAEVMTEIERRADEQEKEAEEMRSKAESTVDSLMLGCQFFGSCFQ